VRGFNVVGFVSLISTLKREASERPHFTWYNDKCHFLVYHGAVIKSQACPISQHEDVIVLSRRGTITYTIGGLTNFFTEIRKTNARDKFIDDIDEGDHPNSTR
jgi:hypothetical protein